MQNETTETQFGTPIEAEEYKPKPQPYYFTPSTIKLVVMSLCTLGLYEIYWFYKNWKCIKERTYKDLMPFWRAFFASLWAYSFFKHLKLDAQKVGAPEPPSIIPLAVLYFMMVPLHRLPDPYWLLSIMGFLALIPINTAALEINKKVGSENYENAKFTVWNWIIIACGGFIVLLAIIGTFIPEP